ncbi:hypothetical protein DSAG12_02614 [Promethearchaeum syntrophicum]|uniref:Uncharacterized protein n=1 Tax=Promethearchaeum syntrophicum TaxID=2594042 RepID=A0A5B9DC81_9ARCH|nr:hypothetical protein [Candidatus Prometheoarchaeum syntrophicum]QEE16784.1 hypothetical protein DSAG12_02614 [Candidatus Prometheoarchaeum syntrophicum]
MTNKGISPSILIKHYYLVLSNINEVPKDPFSDDNLVWNNPEYLFFEIEMIT